MITCAQIIKIIKIFRWGLLHKIFGCAHNSIIGFVSTGWINLEKSNTALDGAPCVRRDIGSFGQQYADILLCKEGRPFIVVEVEAGVSKYREKLNSLKNYLRNRSDFGKLGFGLLIMTNAYDAQKGRKYKHNWALIKKQVRFGKDAIALVSIEKRQVKTDNSIMGRLRKRNDYYPWEIENIDYWVFDGQRVKTGNLWRID